MLQNEINAFHSWYDQNRNYIEAELGSNFSLVDTEVNIGGKEIRNRRPLVNIDLARQPGFITTRILSLKFRLDSINEESRGEIVGGIVITHEPVRVAKISGIIAYKLYDGSPKKEHSFTSFMEVGDVLDFLAISDLHTGLLHVLDPSYPVCQLRTIDCEHQSVTIGPVPDEDVKS